MKESEKQLESKTESQTQPQSEPQPEPRPEPLPEIKPESQPIIQPQEIPQQPQIQQVPQIPQMYFGFQQPIPFSSQPVPMMYPPQMPPPMMEIPPMRVFEPKSFRALLISDSHLHGPYLNNLSDWMKANKPDYDMIFIIGNACNMLNKFRNDYQAEYEAADQLASTIEFLKDLIEKPVVYIPGNTEPTGTYNYSLEIPGAINIHKRAIQLDEGLVLIGLGGSVPVKKDDKEVLEGYPYVNEEDFNKDLTMCVETATKTFGPDISYLLMTHVGPSESGTSEVCLGNDQVNGGIKGFAGVLKDNFIGLIHGHSSNAEGLTKPFGASVPVINPGGLVNGRFGELTLRRDFTGKWKISDAEFRSLN